MMLSCTYSHTSPKITPHCSPQIPGVAPSDVSTAAVSEVGDYDFFDDCGVLSDSEDFPTLHGIGLRLPVHHEEFATLHGISELKGSGAPEERRPEDKKVIIDLASWREVGRRLGTVFREACEEEDAFGC